MMMPNGGLIRTKQLLAQLDLQRKLLRNALKTHEDSGANASEDCLSAQLDLQQKLLRDALKTEEDSDANRAEPSEKENVVEMMHFHEELRMLRKAVHEARNVSEDMKDWFPFLNWLFYVHFAEDGMVQEALPTSEDGTSTSSPGSAPKRDAPPLKKRRLSKKVFKNDKAAIPFNMVAAWPSNDVSTVITQ